MIGRENLIVGWLGIFRCHDAELMNLGLTLPGFVERSKTIASLPSLGLLTLAGLTPPEHSVAYLEIPGIRAAGTLPDGFDLVGISSYTAQIDEAYELADRYRAAGVPGELALRPPLQPGNPVHPESGLGRIREGVGADGGGV